MSDQDRKLLWGKAGNRCAICKKLLVNVEDNDERGVIIGIEAHIVGHSEDGPRGNDPLPLTERHKYENIVLLCSEHATTIDERTDVWTVEKLRALKKEHELLMMEITPSLTHPHPVLRLVLPVGYTGGPNGHFQSLTLKNFDTEAALDLKCWMEGFGFHLMLSTETAGTYLEAGESKEYKFQLDGQRIANADENVQLLSFYASYSNLDGQRILYKSSLVQKTVPSGAFKIIELGSNNSYSKLRSEAKIDAMEMLGYFGGSRQAMFTVGVHKFKIKVSDSLLATWGMNTEQAEDCLRELGKANLKIMTSLGVFQDKEYTTLSFPEATEIDFPKFIKALEYIESGSY